MLVQIITLKFNPALEQFDDKALKDFIKDKDVLAVREHFFIKNGAPFISLVITYRMTDQELQVYKDKDKVSRKSDESWRKILSKDDIPLFNTLRDWRSKRAKQDNAPVYI